MNEKFRDHYFTAVRTALLLITTVYTVISCSLLTGASEWVLLLLALFIGTMSVKEIAGKRVRAVLLAAAVILYCVILYLFGNGTILLGIAVGYEILTLIKPDIMWYILPAGLSFINSGDIAGSLLFSLLICIVYIQHDHVVTAYRNQTREDTINEQQLKHDISQKEHELRDEMKKSLLSAENKVLEERAQLSQTLHDKLGHNINGSIYQLEAVKVLMEKDPERSRTMIQAVIDQLRTGMDEIRAILRKKRPEKHLLAAAQLERLCEDCRAKGIDTELKTEGELSAVSERCLEVILDNCFEAVSNSLKYSKCTRITIHILVMNKFVRCTVADNGTGCGSFADGMGISGMRRRVRQTGGMLEISPEPGFTVNMLLPL